MSEAIGPARARALPPHFGVPWNDRAGRFSRLKAAVLAAMVLPGAWMFGEWAAGGLGALPATRAIHIAGQWMVALLLIGLALRPARALLNWPRAMLLRRMLGLGALAYGLLHLTLYADQQSWRLLHVASEIALRFYLTIGFAALLGLAVLGATSTDRWQRRLGQRWGRLHRLVYVLVAVGLLHFFIQSKADVGNATIATGVFAWLMLWRALPDRLERSLPAASGLGVVASLLAALAEYLWYRFETHIPASRVLMAEATLRFGPRPAGFVLLLGVVALLAIVIRRAWRRPERPLSHPVLYGGGMASVALLAWGMDYGGGALPDPVSANTVSLLAVALAAWAGLARWRLADARLRAALDLLFLACLAYPLYTLGLDSRVAGLVACVVLPLALACLALAAARVSRPAALLLLPAILGGATLAASLA